MSQLPTPADIASYCSQFDKEGESAIRIAVESSTWQYDPPTRAAAIEWLRLKDVERVSEASAKRDTREEETLAIAKEANSIARSASREVRKDRIIAIAAIIIAAISAHKEIKWLIWSVISLSSK